MEHQSCYDSFAFILFVNEDQYQDWRVFVELCHEHKLDPMTEVRKAIQARYDAMLAE